MSEISSTKSITTRDFSKICRICFGNENLFPIFDLIVDDTNGTDLLENSVDLQVKHTFSTSTRILDKFQASRGDNLPENICESCIKELDKIFKFKRKCKENDTILKLLMDENTEYNQELTVVKIENDEINEVDYNDEECEEKVVTQELLYQCQYCPQVFEMYSKFRAHKRKFHYKKNTVTCEVCGKVFPKEKLKRHMSVHTTELYRCDICSRSFKVISNFRRHQLAHAKDRPLVCGKCGKEFTQLRYLIAHETMHERKAADNGASSSFKCEICGVAFKFLSGFNAHLEKHGLPKTVPDSSRACKTQQQLKNFICDQCGKSFSRNTDLKIHMRTHAGEKPHKCDLCDKLFTQKGSLVDHILTHSGYKPYACDQCPKAFARKSHLTAHLKTHTGEKPYMCKYCGKTFFTSWSLKLHERMHTGEKPHVCEVCEKGFYYSSNLKMHMSTHNGIKPFSCSHCPKTFVREWHLIRHVRTHTGEKPYVCESCGKSFISRECLTLHNRRHTGERPFACQVCTRRFYDSNGLKKHKKSHAREMEQDLDRDKQDEK